MDKVKEYYGYLIEEESKLTFKEYDNLLKEKKVEAKEKFVISFLPYVYDKTKKVYELQKELFNAYYSYEDYFSDSIILVEKMYDNWKNKSKDNNFTSFQKYFYYNIVILLTKTYFKRIRLNDLMKTERVMAAYKRFIEDNGCAPSFEELSKITNIPVIFIKRICSVISINGINEVVEFEDELIKKMGMSELKSSVESALSALNENSRKIVEMRNGFSDGIAHSFGEIAQNMDITYNDACWSCHNSYRKMRKLDVLQKYRNNM